MDEFITTWWNRMIDSEIEEVRGAIKNEHLLELGYDGDEPNPHTINIENMREYIKVLETAKK